MTIALADKVYKDLIRFDVDKIGVVVSFKSEEPNSQQKKPRIFHEEKAKQRAIILTSFNMQIHLFKKRKL